MRKAILYIFILGLFFSNSQIHAMASSDAKAKAASHKKTADDGLSKKGSSSRKFNLLTDFDDYDECDDHDASAKDNLYVNHALYFNSNQLTEDYNCKTFCSKIYYNVNFSRLPRYNYISLRVLRI